jgi:N-acetylglucosamine kinase-like BadF-type ATPase
MRIVLGIDGGGTKTRCLAADGAGRILGEGLAGPSNYQVLGTDGAVAAVMAAVAEALGVAGADLADVDAVCAGLAGVGRPEDHAVMTAALPFAGPVKLQVVPDARIALAGALGGKPGAVVISGTGSIAYGIDAGGRTARAGGWGWILGDEGSGYDIGKRAIMALLAAEDGTGPATALSAAICQAWGLERVEQVVPAVYGDLVAAKPRIASLVPVVIAAADAHDGVAAGLLAAAGRDLGGLAAAVLNRLALPDPLVAVTGGVLSGCLAVRAAMAAALADLAPGARLVASAGSPAEGAVWLARQL